jgi:hypothetical protein
MNKKLNSIKELVFGYKYYILSLLLFLAGVKLFSLSGAAKIPECGNPNVLEKLRHVISSNLSGEKYSGNKVTSIFGIGDIDEATNSARSCRAGITIEGSELGNVNYTISISAPGSEEKINIDTSLD